MRGWLVLYSFGLNKRFVLPKHYKTEANAHKFAERHKEYEYGRDNEAVVVNVEDLIAWINAGRDELERLFRL